MKKLAGKQSISSVIRSKLFLERGCQHGKNVSYRPRKVNFDNRFLAQILGVLGRSEVFQSLQDIAEAGRVGRPVSPVISIQAIDQCKSDIIEIKSLLMKALGVEEE